jgi:hypothetical protein
VNQLLQSTSPATNPGAPYPRFPVKFIGFRALHAPFPIERRTRSHVQRCAQEIRGISLVFREMGGATVGRPFTTWTNTSRRAVDAMSGALH